MNRIMSKNRMASILFLFLLLFLISPASAQPGPVIHCDRTNAGWVAWFLLPTNGLWAIQASPTLLKGDWFYPPNFTSDGVRMECFTPNTPQMFFQARRIR